MLKFIARYPFLLFAAVMLLSGCADTSEEVTLKLQGDWASAVFPTNRQEQHRMVFSFEGSTCTMINPFATVSGFKIRDGVLFKAKAPEDATTADKGWSAFRIVRLDNDTLALYPLDSMMRKTIAGQFPGLKSDTLVLAKIRRKNTFVPTSVSFYSSMCYGTCPSMSMEIGKNGSVRYFGSYYSEQLGGHSGQLQKKEYGALVEYIQKLPLKEMKASYEAGWSDQQTCCLVLQSKEGTKQYYVYGYGEEPVELRLLFRKLFDIPRVAKLSPDPLVKESSFAAYYFYQHFTRDEGFVPPDSAD